jgi:C1A family cysteine protease
MPDRAAERIQGYHLVECAGWTENDEVIFLNSWGPEYGDRGFGYLPKDYLITEMWAVTDNYTPNGVEEYRGMFEITYDENPHYIESIFGTYGFAVQSARSKKGWAHIKKKSNGSVFEVYNW